MSRKEQQSRYPGIRAFEKDEQGLFFGRKEETKQLFSQIKTQNLTVLFAKSGIGKSSLINASILPLLNQNLYCPIKIRFQGTGKTPVEIFKMALSSYVDEPLLQRNLPSKQSAATWEYLRACRFERDGKELTPVLILDQFEEFFDHSIEAQNELAVELADMTSHRLPNRIQDQLRSIPFMERDDEDLFWHNPIPVKILIAIRSDRIGLLDNLSSEIPSILHNRFQLKPLNRQAARHAIVEPALLRGRHFATRIFEYGASVLDKILMGLSNDKGDIEPFQLQLLCQHVEKQIQHNPEGLETQVITESFFKNKDGFGAALNAILNNYYENELNELTEEERVKARKFIEEGLIINGRRAGLTEGVEKENYQIEKTLLYKLLDSRLIREENTHLGKSYEISHDTLVAPILSSYEKRMFVEEQQQRAIDLKRERKRLMSALALALIGFSLAAVALVFYFQANQSKEVALVERLRAEEALTRFQEKQIENIQERYNRFISNGKNYTLQNEFSQAIDEFELALQTLDDFAEEIGNKDIINQFDNGGQKARQLINSTQEKGSHQIQFLQLIDEGEAFENRGERYYVDARQKFTAAQNLNYDNALANSKLYQIRGKLEVAFIQFVKNGDVFFKAKGYAFALDNYQAAIRIKPNDESLPQKIRRCKSLNQN